MHLTAEAFTELIQALRSTPQAGAEKRVKPRVGMRRRANIVVRDPQTGFGQEVPVGVRDVSARGMGLTCARGFKPGDTFALLLEGAKSDVNARCTVIYCRKVSDELYRIGVKLDD